VSLKIGCLEFPFGGFPLTTVLVANGSDEQDIAPKVNETEKRINNIFWKNELILIKLINKNRTTLLIIHNFLFLFISFENTKFVSKFSFHK